MKFFELQNSQNSSVIVEGTAFHVKIGVDVNLCSGLFCLLLTGFFESKMLKEIKVELSLQREPFQSLAGQILRFSP